MSNPSAMAVVACAAVMAACSGHPSADLTRADIANVKNLKSSFGPQFHVSEVGPTAVDPRLLAPQAMPPGMKFDPPDCAKFAAGPLLPQGLKGNMAATAAEGEGNRFIVMAVETSEPMPLNEPGENCRKVAFTGPAARGLIEVVDAPQIVDVHTLGAHRVVQTIANGQPASGELYNFVAGFGPFTVIVTANPLVLPGEPVVPVNTQRARELLGAAVAAVRG